MAIPHLLIKVVAGKVTELHNISMENIRVKILRETPFDKIGAELKISDFRLKYGYICSKDVSNAELISYLLQEEALNKRNLVKDMWFEVIEIAVLPLAFIHEDTYYTKELDGMYHAWSSPSHKALFLSPVNYPPPLRSICIGEAQKLVESSKYQQKILYCTNSVNKKL